MTVLTKKVATLATGEQGEIEGFKVGGAVGEIANVRDVITITCDFAACHNGKFVGAEKGPVSFVVDGELPAEYYPGIRTYNAKDEMRWFCGRRCLEQYLATDYVSCPIPGLDNVIEFPRQYGPSDVRRRA
jgi:hypothetical protein